MPSMEEDTYLLRICGLVRDLPKIALNDELSIASFVMLGDTELIEACAAAIVDRPDFPADGVDVLLCPEAKAIPLTHAMARLLGRDYVVARKSVKAYMRNPVVAEAQSITTEGDQILVLDGRDAERLRGRRVAVVDDVVSTGGSLRAVENLLPRVDCRVVCKVAVLLEDAGYDGDDLIYVERLPVFRRSS